MATIKRIKLSDAGYAGLTAVVEKLNKRADKHGMNKLVVTVVSTEDTLNKDTGVIEHFTIVDIEGEAPCINGWYFAARIENNENIGNVVRVVPGKFADSDFSEYRTHDFSCDHCNTKRRRNDVFVLANDNGEFKVVGRNCLADFLRTGNANSFAEYAESFDKLTGMTESDYDDEAYEGGFARSKPVVALRTYIAVCRICEMKLGWVSRSQAYDDPGLQSTADAAYFVIFGRGDGHTDFIKNNDLFVTEGCYDFADRVIAWAKTLTDCKSEYLEIIRKIGTADVVDGSLAGYAASMGRAYEKEQAWKTEREEKQAGAKARGYIGDVGKRMKDQVVTVIGTSYVDGSYGVSTIVRMEAKLSEKEVAPIVWFASGSKEFKEGAEYFLTGTVKSQDEHNRYGKQTKVNRCKLIPCA